jgi:hypothetical protein
MFASRSFKAIDIMGISDSCIMAHPGHYDDSYSMSSCGHFEYTLYPYRNVGDQCSGTNYQAIPKCQYSRMYIISTLP